MSFDSMHCNECIHSSISLEKEKNIFSSDILPSYVCVRGDDVGNKGGRGKERKGEEKRGKERKGMRRLICVVGR